jgi:transposase
VHYEADSFCGDMYAQTNVEPSLCNTHARRKFEAITKTTKKKGLAHHAMSVYAKLHHIERKIKGEKRTCDEIKTIRQEKSASLLINFKQWLEQKQTLVPAKPLIAKTINYTLRHWGGLIHYCEDGRYPIDNNHTECETKPLVIARKNFLFAASQEGARALCLHFSLIRSAKLHKLDPYQYYVEIMTAIPSCKKADDYEALRPWNIDLVKVSIQDQ